MPIHILSMPLPTFDWLQLLYSAISGFVAALVIWWFDRREKIHYQNMLLVIILELYGNFNMLTSTPPEYPLVFSFDNWDKFKIEVAKRLPAETLSNIEVSYNVIKPLNKVTLSFVKQSCIDKNLDFYVIVRMLRASILDLKEIVRYRDSCFDDMYSKTKNYKSPVEANKTI